MTRPSENHASRAVTLRRRRTTRHVDTDELLRRRMDEVPEHILVQRGGVGLYANRSAREALDDLTIQEICRQRGQVRVVRTDGCPRVVEVSSVPLVFGGEPATA